MQPYENSSDSDSEEYSDPSSSDDECDNCQGPCLPHCSNKGIEATINIENLIIVDDENQDNALQTIFGRENPAGDCGEGGGVFI